MTPRQVITLTVDGNTLTPSSTDAGVQGENEATVLTCAVPADWDGLDVRLTVIAQNGAYDISEPPAAGVITLPLRAGVMVPGPLTVSLRGSDGTGVRKTADCRSLRVQWSDEGGHRVASSDPQAFETILAKAQAAVNQSASSASSASASAAAAKSSETASAASAASAADAVQQVVASYNTDPAADDLASLLAQEVLQHKRALADLEGEINTVTLTNSQTYPFNTSQATVSLSKSRDTMNYRIIPEVTSVAGGFVGDIVISDKALNGFKISFTGSATSVQVKYYVEGGMYQ